jgi:isopenicillin N synthase-like dioxygenase
VTQGKRDLHEAVDMFTELSAEKLADPRLQSLLARRPELQQVLAGKNVWPAAFDRALVERYILSMHELGAAVMRALALSLGLPQEHFHEEHLTDDPFWILRFIHYPAAAHCRDVYGREAEGLGCGEHTDYGCLTIVCQDDTPDSLQVRGKDGRWLMAQPVPGAFVLNIGDMVEKWTAGRYTSTLHRVLPSPPHRSRISVPFFYEPNALACIRPLQIRPLQWPLQLPAHAPPTATASDYAREVIYIEHLYSKVSSNFDFQVGVEE